MVRRILPLLGMCLLASVSLRAQEEKVEVFGGYSYLHFHANPSTNLNGWEASGQYKITNWIGGVADFDGHYGSFSGGFGTSTYTYLIGPQVSFPARVSPFGHLLLGGAHNSTTGIGSSSFAMALGAGIDARMKDKFSWRIFQGDYLLTQFGGVHGGGSQNNFRFSTGVIIRF